MSKSRPPIANDGTSRRVRLSRGLALISVLWVVALLAILTEGLLRTSRTDIRLARNLLEASQAEALADGAVEVALLGLTSPAAGGAWQADGTTHGWRAASGEVRVRVTAEDGKIDLNAAPIALLSALLRAAGTVPAVAESLAAAIVDFRDENHVAEADGAEDQDYRASGADFGAKDAPFAVIEELQQVRGMSPALYRRLSPAITVYTGQETPYAATAPALVREALLIEDPELSPDMIPAVERTEGFDLPVSSRLPTTLASGTAATDSDELLPELVHIRAEARLDGGARFVREAVAVPAFGAPAAPFLILEWRQGADPSP